MINQPRQVRQRNLVWTVGKRFRGVLVRLNENSVAPCGCGGTCQYRRQDAVSRSTVATAPGPLDGMRGIENDVESRFVDPVERAHIGHEVIIPEGRAAFCKKESVAPERAEFIRDILHVPGREK